MGTSSSYGGPGSGTPLVPTWLEPDGMGVIDAPAGDSPIAPVPVAQTSPNTALQPNPEPPPDPNRFRTARTNFSRFAASGGDDRRSLGRAISGYVSTASGGARTAARRMGASRETGERILQFLADVQSRGARKSLEALNFEVLAGRSLEEIFLGLVDYFCPAAGTVDEGIAREAFIDTIVELAKLGIVNLDALTAEQMQTVFEIFATQTIVNRICNDIGTRTVTFPTDVQAAKRVQKQLYDLVRGGVSDALAAAHEAHQALTPESVRGFVGEVYERAFDVLQRLGDTAAEDDRS